MIHMDTITPKMPIYRPKNRDNGMCSTNPISVTYVCSFTVPIPLISITCKASQQLISV